MMCGMKCWSSKLTSVHCGVCIFDLFESEKQLLDKVMEIDHILPLCMGGTNDLSNLQAFCKECHVGKTQEEELSSKRPHTIESQLAQHLWQDLHCGPKPREVSWGIYSSKEEPQKKLKPKKLTDEQMKRLQHRMAFAKKAIRRQSRPSTSRIWCCKR